MNGGSGIIGLVQIPIQKQIDMKKTIHHVWRDVLLTTKKKHKVCTRCGLQKWYDFAWNKMIYYNPRNGTFEYNKTPSCVMPNTKL